MVPQLKHGDLIMAKTRKQLKQENLELSQRLASVDGRSKRTLQANIADLLEQVKQLTETSQKVVIERDTLFQANGALQDELAALRKASSKPAEVKGIEG